jgi:CheY-like chemotaxis protein
MTEDREFRILIVDDQRDVARVLRASLELLNRGYFIVDVPSAEEAMLEIRSKPFDIIVTDYELPGMTGSEFIKRVRKRTPGIQAFVITAHPPAKIRDSLGGVEIGGIFEKPLDTQAFTNAIVRALHGEEEIAEKPAVSPALGQVPEFNEKPIALLLGSLLADLGANAVAFVDRAGNVLLRQGQLDEGMRFSELAVLLAYNFTTTAEISEYLGEGPSGAVHYYDGASYDIYALSVGLHFFVVIVFPGGSQKQMGPVLRFGKPAAAQMIDEIGEAALAIEGAEPEEAAPEEEEEVPEVAPEEEAEEAFTEALTEAAAEFAEPVEQAEIEALPELVIDLDELDAALARDASDTDAFWAEAAENEGSYDDETMSLEEARELGIITDIGED